MRIIRLLPVVALLTVPSAWAEDKPDVFCKSAAELYADGDLKGALEEAKWCVTMLEQEAQSQVNNTFPDELLGFVGQELEHQSAMGFSSTVREYRKGEKTVTVTLSGGESMGGMLGTIAAMAQYGGGKKVRIDRRSATVMNDGGQIQISIGLKSGGVLMIETYDLDEDAAVEFAKAFPVAEVDDAQ